MFSSIFFSYNLLKTEKTPILNGLPFIYLFIFVISKWPQQTSIRVVTWYVLSPLDFVRLRANFSVDGRARTTNLGHTDDFNVDKLRGRRSRPERVLFTLDHSAGDGGGTFRINHRPRPSFCHSAAYQTGRRETRRARWAQMTVVRVGI